jgi:hypothetical protein
MKSAVTQCIGAVLVCLMVLIAYSAWYAFVSRKSNEVAEIERSIVEKTQAQSRIAAARATLAEIEDEEFVVQNYFVSDTAVVNFINYLEDRGSSQNAAVDVVSVSTGSDKTRPTLILTLTVKGLFDAVMRTVGAIEYAPYDVRVAGLTVALDKERTWNANLIIVVGSVPKAQATAPTPQKTP